MNNSKLYLWVMAALIIVTLSVSTAFAETIVDTPQISQPALPTPTARSDGEVEEWQARLELARLLTYSQRYQEAISEYRKVLQIKPELTEAAVGLAQALFWSGEPEAALGATKGISTRELNDADRLFLADLLVTDQQYREAIKLYEQYLIANPQEHPARLKMALALAWAEDYPQAIDQFDRLVKALPEDRQLKRKFAQVLSWAGQNERAIKLLQESLGE